MKKLILIILIIASNAAFSQDGFYFEKDRAILKNDDFNSCLFYEDRMLVSYLGNEYYLFDLNNYNILESGFFDYDIMGFGKTANGYCIVSHNDSLIYTQYLNSNKVDTMLLSVNDKTFSPSGLNRYSIFATLESFIAMSENGRYWFIQGTWNGTRDTVLTLWDIDNKNHIETFKYEKKSFEFIDNNRFYYNSAIYKIVDNTLQMEKEFNYIITDANKKYISVLDSSRNILEIYDNNYQLVETFKENNPKWKIQPKFNNLSFDDNKVSIYYNYKLEYLNYEKINIFDIASGHKLFTYDSTDKHDWSGFYHNNNNLIMWDQHEFFKIYNINKNREIFMISDFKGYIYNFRNTENYSILQEGKFIKVLNKEFEIIKEFDLKSNNIFKIAISNNNEYAVVFTHLKTFIIDFRSLKIEEIIIYEIIGETLYDIIFSDDDKIVYFICTSDIYSYNLIDQTLDKRSFGGNNVKVFSISNDNIAKMLIKNYHTDDVRFVRYNLKNFTILDTFLIFNAKDKHDFPLINSPNKKIFYLYDRIYNMEKDTTYFLNEIDFDGDKFKVEFYDDSTLFIFKYVEEIERIGLIVYNLSNDSYKVFDVFQSLFVHFRKSGSNKWSTSKFEIFQNHFTYFYLSNIRKFNIDFVSSIKDEFELGNKTKNIIMNNSFYRFNKKIEDSDLLLVDYLGNKVDKSQYRIEFDTIHFSESISNGFYYLIYNAKAKQNIIKILYLKNQ